MSTICCMLHLFGKRLGQKGSTLYVGAFCECASGTAAKTPKQESAMTMAEALVHPTHMCIDNSSFPPVSILKFETHAAVYSWGCSRAFPSPFFRTNFCARFPVSTSPV